MVFILPILFIISLFGIRLQKCNSEENTYMSKDSSNAIRGIFIILIFCATFLGGTFTGFASKDSMNMFDTPMLSFFSNFEQLLYVPFFFYSGFGIFETYKNLGKEYAKKIPLQQILRHFISYFVAWVFFAITALALHSNYSIQDYLLSIIGISSIGNPTNWFVFVMIFLYLFSFVSFRIADNKTAVIIHVALVIFLYFMFRSFAHDGSPYLWNSMPAYVFGVIYSYLKERIEPKLFKHRITRYIVFVISSGLLAVSMLYIKQIPYSDFRNAAFLVPSFFFSVALISFTSIVRIKNKVLNFIGSNSFWIYILMQLPCIWLYHIDFIANQKYVYFIISVVIVVGLAFLFNKIFNYFWNIFAKNHGQASEESNIQLGIAISYIALIVSAIGAFVVTPRVLENLGDKQYGLLAFANSITAWLTVITTALAASYIKFAAKYQKENKDVGIVNTSYLKIFAFSALIMFGIIAIGVFVLFGFNIQLPQYSAEENRLILFLILVSGINVSINVMFSVFNNFLTYKKQFIFIRLLALVISFLTFACNLIFSFVFKKVLVISIVAVVLTSISSLITIVYAFRKERMTFAKTNYKENSPLIRAIIVFSGFILLNAIVDRVNTELDKTLLGLMVNAEAVTDYTLSKYFNTYFLTLSLAISSTYVPKIHELVAKDSKIIVSAYYEELVEKEKELYKEELARYKAAKKNKTDRKAAKERLLEAKKTYKEKCKIAKLEINNNLSTIKAEIKEKENKKELSSLFLKICRSQMLILFLVGGGFFAVGKEFMNLWLGAEKDYIYYYALVPISLDMFSLSVNTCIEIQRALNKHKFRAFLYIALALINIGISVLLIKILPDGYQVWGAFIGTAVSVIMGNIIILNLYNKLKIGLPMGSYFLSVFKHVLYAGVGVGVAMVLRWIVLPDYVGVSARLLIQGATFVVLYVAMLLIFERKTIIPLMGSIKRRVKAIAKGSDN